MEAGNPSLEAVGGGVPTKPDFLFSVVLEASWRLLEGV